MGRQSIGRSVAAALAGLVRIGKPAIPPGGLVEFDGDAVPWRASLLPESPYYCPISEGLILTLDGREAVPQSVGIGVYEFDRRAGWIEGDLCDAKGVPLMPAESRRLHGRVEARWAILRLPL